MPINGLTLFGGAAGNFEVWPPTPLEAWGTHLPAFLPAHARSQAVMANVCPAKLKLELSPV